MPQTDARRAGGAGSGSEAAETVLLVDDNPDDRELTLMAIRVLAQRVEVLEAADGLEAMDALRPGSDASSAARPALILLDVNMPRLDGKQFLRRLRADEELARTPVIMFTTSTAPWDVDESYAAGCNLYLVKPFAAEELKRMLGDVFRVYLDHAELPSR